MLQGTRSRPNITCCQAVKQPLGSQLAESYTILQKPAKHNISFTKALEAGHSPFNTMMKAPVQTLQTTLPHAVSSAATFLQDFTDKAVLAYECGYSESLVREEMGMGMEPGSSPEDRSPQQVEAEECVLAVALIWITLGMLPRETSRRWAQGVVSMSTFAGEILSLGSNVPLENFLHADVKR